MSHVVRVRGEQGVQEDRQRARAEKALVAHRAVLGEEARSPGGWKEAPRKHEIDRGVSDADVSPVDHARQPTPTDEDVAGVEIAVRQHGLLWTRKRQRLGLAQQRSHRIRRAPETQALQVRQGLARALDTHAHVGASVRIDGEPGLGLDGCTGRGIVQRAQEPSQIPAHGHAVFVGETHLRRLSPAKQKAPEERPRVALARLPDVSRRGNRSGKKRSEAREDGELALDERDGDRPTREAERQALLHHPDRVVEALAEESRRLGVELGKLLDEQPSHEILSDVQIRVPLRHAGNVPAPTSVDPRVRTVSLTALRRIAINAQGYASRPRRGTRQEVDAAIRALTCVQLDSITAVERSHRITLGARVGTYPRETVSVLLGKGRIFEYWAHEACLIPVEEWPLFRAVMRRHHPWRGDVIGQSPELAEEVRAAVRERGPIASRDFDGKGGGGMWNWKPAKIMLEALWNSGEIVIAGRVSGFQRLYDLAERVIPREILDAPEPDEPTRLRELAIRAVRARGVLTEGGIVEHWRLRGGTARVRPHVDALVADGVLERLRVEDGGADVLVRSGTDLDPPRPTASALLSPFDNLLWDRPFARRVLGFDHLIEVYKPAPERRYGYYVLPLLWRDRVVGRADLKAERREGALVVKALHLERGVRRSGALDDAFERALDRLRRTIGLERVIR